MYTIHVWQAIEGDKSLVRMNFLYTNDIDNYIFLQIALKTHVNINGVL